MGIETQNMEEFQNYLESSTVHGLFYIGTTRRLVKLFWIIVVLTGFIGAGILIKQSFQSWQDSPVKTTIETRPISEVTLPKISVCPAKNTYTNLNYDLMKMKENVSIPVDMSDYADNLRENFIRNFQDVDYQEQLKKIGETFKEENRFRNWYTGKR